LDILVGKKPGAIAFTLILYFPHFTARSFVIVIKAPLLAFIITGGGRGLGSQIAEGFAEAGANIVLCSRKLEACEEVAAELEAKDARTLAIKCDVTNAEDINTVVEETMNKFGSIDILVNNSGASWGAPALEMPIEAWKKVIDVNLTGTFLMSQAVGKICRVFCGCFLEYLM